MDVQVTETEPGTRWRATIGDREDGVGVFLGQMHRNHAWLEGGDDLLPSVLREVVAAFVARVGVSLLAKAVPGTSRHRQLVSAGGTVSQVCPPSEVDGTHPDNVAWAAVAPPAGVQVAAIAEMGDEEVLELWVRLYTWVHALWAPVESEEAARAVFGPMLDEMLDRRLSIIVRRNGVGTAVAFVLRQPTGPVCVVAEAVDPASATAPGDVLAVMREVVRRCALAGQDLFFDGHVSDPHYPDVLATIPHVTGRGLHLIRLG